MKPGDIIVAIDGDGVVEADDVQYAIDDKEDGDTVKVTVVRDRKETVISVVVAEDDWGSYHGSGGTHKYHGSHGTHWGPISTFADLGDYRGVKREYKQAMEEYLKDSKEYEGDMRDLQDDLKEMEKELKGMKKSRH